MAQLLPFSFFFFRGQPLPGIRLGPLNGPLGMAHLSRLPYVCTVLLYCIRLDRRFMFTSSLLPLPRKTRKTRPQCSFIDYRVRERERERERKGERESSDDTAATTAHSKSTCPCSTTLTGHVHPRSKRFPAGTRQENSKQARLKFAALVLLFSGTVQTYPGINRRNVIVKKRIDNRIVSIKDEQQR